MRHTFHPAPAEYTGAEYSNTAQALATEREAYALAREAEDARWREEFRESLIPYVGTDGAAMMAGVLLDGSTETLTAEVDRICTEHGTDPRHALALAAMVRGDLIDLEPAARLADRTLTTMPEPKGSYVAGGMHDDYVIGADGDTYHAAPAADLRHRSDMLLMASGDHDDLALVGTDRWNWEHVVPVGLGVTDDMGDSVVNRAGRKIGHHVPRWGAYETGPTLTRKGETSARVDAPRGTWVAETVHPLFGARVLKRYRTGVRVRVGGGELVTTEQRDDDGKLIGRTSSHERVTFARGYFTGHAYSAPIVREKRTTGAATGRKRQTAAEVVADLSALADAIGEQARESFIARNETRAAWTDKDGTRRLQLHVSPRGATVTLSTYAPGEDGKLRRESVTTRTVRKPAHVAGTVRNLTR